MKKLITIMLILSIIFPSSALAVTGDSPYFGKWIARKHGSTANYSEILYYINITKYKTYDYYELCLHYGGILTEGKISDQTIYDGKWEIIDNHLSIQTSGITSIEVYYDKDTDTLYTTDWPILTFVRIP